MLSAKGHVIFLIERISVFSCLCLCAKSLFCNPFEQREDFVEFNGGLNFPRLKFFHVISPLNRYCLLW